MPNSNPYALNPVSIHGEYIQLQALTGAAPVAASQSVGRIFASGSTAALYFINQGGNVTALGGADPPSADGDSLGTADKEWSDLYMADGSIIYLGNDQEVTLTHIHDTGVRLNGAMKLEFRDADVHVSSDANGYLNAQADTGVNLNINGTDRVEVTSAGMNVVGTITGDTSLTLDTTTITTAEIGVLDSVTAGTAAASKAVVLDAGKHVGTLTSLTASALTGGNGSVISADKISVMGQQFYVGDVQVTALGGQLNFNDVTAGTAAASKAVVLDASKNIATIGTVGCGAVTSTGNSSFAQVTTSGRVLVDDSTEATTATDGSLQTDGGLSVVKSAVIGDDLDLLSDSAIFSMGAGQDATLTHDGATGLVIAATPISVNSTGDLTLDSSTDIVLDADGADVILKDGGTEFGRFTNASSDFVVHSAISDQDMLFKGNDGGSTITALTLDMSEAGNATFNGSVTCATSLTIGSAAMSEADLEQLDGITAGTAAASKAVVLDASKNIATIGTVGCGAITSTGASTMGSLNIGGTLACDTSFTLDTTTLSAAELGVLDSVTAGTAAASKALVLDAALNIGTINQLTASHIKVTNLDVTNINSISETALTLEVVDKTILAGLSGSSSDVNSGGYQIGGTIVDGGMARMLWSDAGQALMVYSGSTAMLGVGKDVLGPVTDDGVALGKTSYGFSDLFLASGAVVNFDSGDVTMTHSSNALTVAGGTLATAALTTSTIVASGIVKTDDTTEATSTTDGSLQTDGGLSVAKSAVIGDDLDLLSDSCILNIGSTSKFTLTDQAANNCVMASANHRLAFGDAGEYITGDGTDLSVISSGDIKLDPAGGDVDVDGNIIPNSDSADNLGASGTAWASLFVDAIDLNGQGNISMGGTGRIDLDADDDTSIRASADDVITFEVGGSDELHLNAAALGPASNDGLALGVAGTAFSDVFLASGAVINFDSGNVTMTHSTDYLTLGTGQNMKAHAFVTYSDGRMKKNIKQLDTALDTVQKLRGVSYDWKHDNSSDIGFIAQEVAKVVPSLCHGSEEGGYALDYPSMNALLVEAVKQQQKQIKALSAKVEKLSK